MNEDLNVTLVRHPFYLARQKDWEKYRLTYEGGDSFKQKYLEQFSKRELADDFDKRKRLSYNPAFAQAAVDEIKNSLFDRMGDINRSGGSRTYQDAIAGKDQGVDLTGRSMNSFIGTQIIPELLVMERVGIYIDMPPIPGPTLASVGKRRPYLYRYKSEDILSWDCCCIEDEMIFKNILLRERIFTYDERTGLPWGDTWQFRHMWLDAVTGMVNVRFFDSEAKVGPTVQLNLTQIPFVMPQISHSLLTNAADYQIAYLNVASTDIWYLLMANFPMYTEQSDPIADNEFNKRNTEGAPKVRTGTAVGRKYPKGLDRPQFIHPSPEPLKAAIEKEEQMKMEIRQLVQLAVCNIQPRAASAESKNMDNRSLEAGLSYIGLELENTERSIAKIWAMYENSKDPATINYPRTYSLKSEEERRKDATSLKELMESVPSKTFQKAVAKQIARITVGDRVAAGELDIILKEIDQAKAITSDSKTIAQDIEIGILDLELGASMRGYPEGTVEKAKKDHAERAARIALSQQKGMGARGVADLSADSNDAADEKTKSRDTTSDVSVSDKTRGEGK